MDMNNSAVSDTCMFFFGMCLGITFNYIFNYLLQWYDATERHQFFLIGITQILVNALVIRYVRNHVTNIGLFTLGILSPQYLIIKKCYPEL